MTHLSSVLLLLSLNDQCKLLNCRQGYRIEPHWTPARPYQTELTPPNVLLFLISTPPTAGIKACPHAWPLALLSVRARVRSSPSAEFIKAPTDTATTKTTVDVACGSYKEAAFRLV